MRRGKKNRFQFLMTHAALNINRINLIRYFILLRVYYSYLFDLRGRILQLEQRPMIIRIIIYAYYQCIGTAVLHVHNKCMTGVRDNVRMYIVRTFNL